MMYNLLRQNIEKRILLTDTEWNLVVEKLKFIKLRKNEYLQVQDATSKYEAFVLQGILKMYHLHEDGTENILFFAFESNWICDVESFYHRKKAKYSVKAIEDCEIVVMTKEKKAQLFLEVPKLLLFHTNLIEKATIVMQDRVLDVLCKTSKQRYLDFITRFPKQVQRINDRNLSSYLGVSHEFLCKIKKSIAY